ncbi:MAG: undecaprenyl-diphosphate phosphatase [Pseudomonadota bacterium]
MSFFQLLVIAVLQGITEWLPISSSGHVLLASDLFGLAGRDELLINAVSNLGTLAAMLIYFRKDVAAAIAGGFELVGAAVSRNAALSRGARLALHILVATPFAIIVAIAYEVFLPPAMQNALRSVWTVAAATIGFGLLLWWADVRGSRDKREADMTIRDAALIGASQAVAAVIPGTSRSGITMTAARALGYDRTEAARFSMLIGAPILAAAGLYGAMGLMDTSQTAGMVSLQDGLIVAAFAFLSGIASIAALMALLKRISFLPFVIYRLALGAVLIATAPSPALI